MRFWNIETTDAANKKVEIKLFENFTWNIISQERDITVQELNELFSMVDMMFKSAYTHMECTLGTI